MVRQQGGQQGLLFGGSGLGLIYRLSSSTDSSRRRSKRPRFRLARRIITAPASHHGHHRALHEWRGRQRSSALTHNDFWKRLGIGPNVKGTHSMVLAHILRLVMKLFRTASDKRRRR